MTTRTEFVAEARSWIGVPYADTGTSRKGCNCLGFIVAVARDVGLSEIYELYRPWERMSHPETQFSLLRDLSRTLFRIAPAKAVPGDCLLFNRGRGLTHVAIITERDARSITIINADDDKRKVCEYRLIWNPYAGFQLPGLV